jgi:protein tyrosine/serine phosphatase
MATALRAVLIVALVGIVFVFPIVHYRAVYAHSKRLRTVDPGRLYRCGQLTAAGFADAVRELKIKTVVNVQNDFPDPDIQTTFLSNSSIKESELCAQLGVRYVALAPDLVSRRRTPEERPTVIDEFLAVMDQPDNYPVLLHCKAGLHRTGLLAAIYRMEYQGWSRHAAHHELKAHGFGDWKCTVANDYVRQYLAHYEPGLRRPAGVAQRQSDRTGEP